MPCADEDEWSFVVTGRPVTVNAVYDMHRMARAKNVARLRGEAKLLARAAGIPRPIGGPIEVTSQAFLPDRRWSPDVAAELPVAKAAIDGLVDHGAIPDDNAEWMHRLSFLPPVVLDKNHRKLHGGIVPPYVRIVVTRAKETDQ